MLVISLVHSISIIYIPVNYRLQALGFYNFVRGFRWAYKWGGGGVISEGAYNQRLESAAVMMYKSLHGMTPEYLSSRFFFSKRRNMISIKEY